MIILSIETSCDETAISIVEANGELESPTFSVLGNALFSQVALHKEFGGVYPMLAKREHARNLTPLLEKVLNQAGMFISFDISKDMKVWEEIEKILEREEGLFQSFKNYLENVGRPDIDVIGVTSGPGLAPALWVGISFALALGKLWDIPVVPANHMEGHIASVLFDKTDEFSIFNLKFLKKSEENKLSPIQFPAIAVLISGGHTEIVQIENWGKYKVVGETRDDAVGEAFDKTARMMGLPYPGGPEISKLAEIAREKNLPNIAKLPRPMIHSHDLNFSFSGLKTAVLYYIRDHFNSDGKKMTDDEKADLAREFEDSVVDVMTEKTKSALDQFRAKTLIVAGGVIANKKLRSAFAEFEKKYPGLVVKVPTNSLSTDNSLMIAAVVYINVTLYPEILSNPQKIIANGNLRLS